MLLRPVAQRASAGETYRRLPHAVDVEASAITWEQVADVIELEEGMAGEVSEYLRWRLANIR